MEPPVLTLWSFKHYSVQSLTLKVFSWWCRLHMNNELCCDRSSKSQKATLFSSWVGDAQNESMTRTVGRWFQLVSFHTSTSFVTDPINELEPRAFSLAEVCCERCCLRVKIGHVTRRYLNLLKLWPHSQKTKFLVLRMLESFVGKFWHFANHHFCTFKQENLLSVFARVCFFNWFMTPYKR